MGYTVGGNKILPISCMPRRIKDSSLPNHTRTDKHCIEQSASAYLSASVEPLKADMCLPCQVQLHCPWPDIRAHMGKNDSIVSVTYGSEWVMENVYSLCILISDIDFLLQQRYFCFAPLLYFKCIYIYRVCNMLNNGICKIINLLIVFKHEVHAHFGNAAVIKQMTLFILFFLQRAIATMN